MADYPDIPDFPNLRQAGQYLSDEDARRYDQDFGLRSKQVGIQAAAQKSTAAYQMAEIKNLENQLAEKRREYDLTLGFDREKFVEDTRRYNQDFGEGVRRFDTTTGVSLLGQEAQNRGALNFVQGDMLAQGATQISPWLQSLRTGTPVSYSGGTATGMNPTPLTNTTLANQYANQYAAGQSPADQALAPAQQGAAAAPGSPRPGGASTDQYGRPKLSPDVQAAVDAGSAAFTGGLANMPQGWLENMTDDQRKALVSIGDYLGRNTASDIEYYNRSRAGQRSALGA